MIQIPEPVFGQMLTVLGYPFITVAPDSAENVKGFDLELTSKQIKDFIIEPYEAAEVAKSVKAVLKLGEEEDDMFRRV